MLAVLLGFVLLAAAGVFAFLKFYGSYIDRTLYTERLNQMQEVTSQFFSGLEDVIDNQWHEARVQCSTSSRARRRSCCVFCARRIGCTIWEEAISGCS